MNRLERMLEYGTITMAKGEIGYNMVFEPDANRNPSYKRTTFLIKRERASDLIDDLETYLDDLYRGVDDYPRSFFDPEGKWADE